jgi:predicted nucleic acid-binding protein
VVLDTNVALDLLVFLDPNVALLARALEEGLVEWVACQPMRAELERTLSYPAIQRRLLSPHGVLIRFDQLVRVTAAPSLPDVGRLRCADTDDQVFIDLALEQRATWLLSHDSMVRRLAPRAARLGLWIGPPVGFSLQR